MTLRAWGLSLILLMLAAPFATTAAAALPAAVKSAQAHAPVPGGGWLVLDKHALRLLDAAGQARDELKLRGKHLDTRRHPAGLLALLVDADRQQTLAVTVDAAAMRLQARVVVESPPFSLAAACLLRDGQGLDHWYLIGDEGLAEQWLLRPSGALLERRLALPAMVQACRGDDAAQRLLLLEEGVAVHAYLAAAADSPPKHQIIAQPPRRLAGDDKARAAWLERAFAAVPPAARPPGQDWPVVPAAVQTEPMARFGDAADDPAIWVHPNDGALSRVLATNKKQGLLVYDLHGRQTQLLEVGRVNNVDLRQGVRLGETTLDLAVATQRDEAALVVFSIDAAGQVAEAARIATGLDDIYGVCLHRTPDAGLDVFVNDKDGRFLRYRLQGQAGRVSAAVVQRFRVRSQPEACVADDRAQRLFIGEEKRGVWVMALDRPDPDSARLELVLPLGPLLHADVEGLALYHGAAGSWLVVSSQGSDSYLVAEAAPPYRVRGAFRIGIHADAAIDGVSETDGLEATSAALGPRFPQGMLVVQDGHKRLPDGPQNFKLVDWRDIAAALRLP